MKKRNALTLVELLVVIGVLFFLLAIVMPALVQQRRPARSVMCTANLRDLSIAWIIYADDNDGKIVNGQPNDPRTTGGPPPDKVYTEKPWALEIALNADGNPDPAVSRHDQEQLIKTGALWPNIKNLKSYRCPDGKAKHMRTYSIVCSLNGDRNPVESLSNKELLCVKNRSLVRNPHDRIVFVCEGCVNNLSFRVGYTNPGKWIDPPPARHRGGMNFVFADGHSGYWKWKGKGTVDAGERRQFNYTPVPGSVEDGRDLRDMRIAVWGKIP